jgi:hypothetical protein
VNILALIGASLFLFGGIALIYGTYARWRFLIDPPDDMFWVYSHSFLKRFIGSRGLIYYNYIAGTLLVAGFVYALVRSLTAGP